MSLSELRRLGVRLVDDYDAFGSSINVALERWDVRRGRAKRNCLGVGGESRQYTEVAVQMDDWDPLENGKALSIRPPLVRCQSAQQSEFEEAIIVVGD